MGTTTEGVIPQASSSAVLILMGSRSEHAGRETLICGACGRGQFNRGQSVCVACRASLLARLEPLSDSDEPTSKIRTRKFAPRNTCKKVKDLRRALEMSQGLLALQVGCARTHISRLESAINIPTIAFLGRVATGLNVTIGELLEESTTVEELAARSLVRSGELIETLIVFLPKLNPNSRAILLEKVKAFHRSRPAPAR